MSAPHKLVVGGLAPVAPPCFPTRSIWVEYLTSAAEEARSGHPSPLITARGRDPAFNYGFDFCADCSMPHEREMRRVGRCKPDHLRACEPQPIVFVVPPKPWQPWAQVDWINGAPTAIDAGEPAPMPPAKSDLVAQLRKLIFTVPKSVREGSAQSVWEWRSARNRAAMFAANARSGLRTLKLEISNLARFQ